MPLLYKISSPKGNRTPVSWLRTMCPSPLDDGARAAPQGLEPRPDEPESSVLPLDDGAKY